MRQIAVGHAVCSAKVAQLRHTEHCRARAIEMKKPQVQEPRTGQVVVEGMGRLVQRGVNWREQKPKEGAPACRARLAVHAMEPD